MNCKNCGNKFKMYEIPVDERVYGPLSAIFPCPQCQILLQADKRFRVLNMIGIILFGLSFLALVVHKLNWLDIDYQLYLSVMILSGIFFIASFINIQTEIIE